MNVANKGKIAVGFMFMTTLVLGAAMGIWAGMSMAPKQFTPEQIFYQCQQDAQKAISDYKSLDWVCREAEKDCNRNLADFTVCREDLNYCNSGYDGTMHQRNECEYVLRRCERSPLDCQKFIQRHKDH